MKEEVIIHHKSFVPYLKAEEIRMRVKSLGDQIAQDYNGKKPVMIGVLNGAFIFMADLLRNMNIDCEISFIRVASYEGTSSTGKVRNIIGLNDDIEGRDVVIVEDIIDTGDTAMYLINMLNEKRPASLRFATMLFKPAALKHPFKPDYTGFEIEPLFVVGYGLDFDGAGRNLPDIYHLKNE